MGEDYGAINGLYIGGDSGIDVCVGGIDMNKRELKELISSVVDGVSCEDGTLTKWWDKSSNVCTAISDNSYITVNDNSWIPISDNGIYSTTGFTYDSNRDYAAEWLEKMRKELDKQCTNVEKEKRYEIRHGAYYRRKYRSLEFKCTLVSNWKNIFLDTNGRYVLKHR